MQHASFAYSKCQILLSLIHGEVLSGIIENVLIRHRTTTRLFHNDDTFFLYFSLDVIDSIWCFVGQHC